jgi:hypothetical protein
VAVVGLLVVGLIVVVVVSGGLNSKKTVPLSDAPPNGQIWFGSTYDTSTFALSGQTTSIPVGSGVALVAALNRSAGANERLTIDATIAGTQLPIGFGTMNAGDDLLADHVEGGLFPLPGTYLIQIQDAGGNVLASGTLTVH